MTTITIHSKNQKLIFNIEMIQKWKKYEINYYLIQWFMKSIHVLIVLQNNETEIDSKITITFKNTSSLFRSAQISFQYQIVSLYSFQRSKYIIRAKTTCTNLGSNFRFQSWCSIKSRTFVSWWLKNCYRIHEKVNVNQQIKSQNKTYKV